MSMRGATCLLAGVAVVAVSAGCSGGSGSTNTSPSASASANSTAGSASASASVADFCRINDKLDQELSAAFANAGNAADFSAAMKKALVTYRDDIDTAQRLAPPEVRADLATVVRSEQRIAAGADFAQLTKDPAFTGAVGRLDAYRKAHCHT